MRVRIHVLALTLVILGCARASEAGLVDWIFELSGPAMFGVNALECKYYFSDTSADCFILYWDGSRRSDVRVRHWSARLGNVVPWCWR